MWLWKCDNHLFRKRWFSISEDTLYYSKSPTSEPIQYINILEHTYQFQNNKIIISEKYILEGEQEDVEHLYNLLSSHRQMIRENNLIDSYEKMILETMMQIS